MTRNPRRQVVINLTADEWRQLARQATASERDPYQQARWLLVQRLRESTSTDEMDEESDRPAVAV